MLNTHSTTDSESDPDPNNPLPTPSNVCPTHGTILKHFCLDCRGLLCGTCLQEDDRARHKGHVLGKTENFKKTAVSDLSSLVTEVEKRLVELNDQVDNISEQDATVVSSCKASVDTYYDDYVNRLEKKIATLKDRLQSANTHRSLLLQKLDSMSATQVKNRAVDMDSVLQMKENLCVLLRSAKTFIRSNDDVGVLTVADSLTEQMRRAVNDRIDPSTLQSVPKVSFSKTSDPLACEIVNPRGITVEGLERASAGTNTFNVMLTTPLVNKPRFRVNVTLPNGKKADADTIQFKPVGDNAWSICYYIPPTSFPFSGFFSTGGSKVIIRILLCDVEIEGSPFEIPCDKLIGKDLVRNVSV